MDRETFILCIPSEIRSSITASTIDIWHAMFDYVTEHGQTDNYDHRLSRFLKERLKRWPSESLVSTHLRRLARSGIFSAYRVSVKPGPLGSLFGFTGIMNSGPNPGVFHCYALKGKKVDLDLAGQRNFSSPK